MIVQINSDNILTVSKEKAENYTSKITEDLKRFSSQLTRIEVHFTDENGIKTGINDIRCVMEARLEGMQPIAVTSKAGSREEALAGAINKLKASLETITGKMSNH